MNINVEDDPRSYLHVINGFLNLLPSGRLTDTEIDVLACFIETHPKLEEELNTSVNPFATAVRKEVANRLGRDDYRTLNYYIKNLKDKEVIIPLKGGGYRFHPIVLPKDELTFQFNE